MIKKLIDSIKLNKNENMFNKTEKENKMEPRVIILDGRYYLVINIKPNEKGDDHYKAVELMDANLDLVEAFRKSGGN